MHKVKDEIIDGKNEHIYHCVTGTVTAELISFISLQPLEENLLEWVLPSVYKHENNVGWLFEEVP